MDSIKRKFNEILDNPVKRKRLTIFAVAGLVIVSIVLIIQFTGPSIPRELYIDTVATSIASRVKVIDVNDKYYNTRIRNKTKSFYNQTGNKTKWLEYRGPGKNFKAFLESVKHTAQYGLNPEHYGLAALDSQVQLLFKNKKRTTEDVSTMDIRITGSFFLFTTHLIEGRIRTAGYGENIWKKNIPKENDIQLLADNSSGDLEEIIEALHPDNEQYEKMQKALLQYRRLEQKAAISLAGNKLQGSVKPGKKHPSIPKIRRRLFLTDLEPYVIPDDSLQYDEKMANGIKEFQERHGLTPDGIISEYTLKYLDQSMKYKADLIELNLERLRWLPREYPKEYISINVPEYMLRVYKGKKTSLEMKVVLGDEFNTTPVFIDTLEYIVFSPTWTVPPGIMEEEVIPNLKGNPLAYDTTRFRILKKGKMIDPTEEDWQAEDLDPKQYEVIEKPGPDNSLGLVKFMMPNDMHIYLHDTPADHLFNKRKRAYSHGCIRLERPMDMTKYLLADQPSWDEKKIAEAMKSEEPTSAPLKKKLPVHIDYRTVWVDEEGKLNFREDIYGHDQQQLRKLNRVDAILLDEKKSG